MLTLFLTTSIVFAKPTHENIVLPDSCAQDFTHLLIHPFKFSWSRGQILMEILRTH